MQCHHYCNEPLHCSECIRRFWQWAERHTCYVSKRVAKKFPSGVSFYVAATKWQEKGFQ